MSQANLTCPATVIVGPTGPPPYQFRTLANILWSCILTIVACTWTSIHPNIWKGATRSQRIYYRATLFITTIVFPEAMAFLAVSQWLAARGLAQKYKGIKL